MSASISKIKNSLSSVNENKIPVIRHANNVSPIDINVSQTEKITFEKLIWTNYQVRPKKMNITNNGRTRN